MHIVNEIKKVLIIRFRKKKKKKSTLTTGYNSIANDKHNIANDRKINKNDYMTTRMSTRKLH